MLTSLQFEYVLFSNCTAPNAKSLGLDISRVLVDVRYFPRDHSSRRRVGRQLRPVQLHVCESSSSTTNRQLCGGFLAYVLSCRVCQLACHQLTHTQTYMTRGRHAKSTNKWVHYDLGKYSCCISIIHVNSSNNLLNIRWHMCFTSIKLLGLQHIIFLRQ